MRKLLPLVLLGLGAFWLLSRKKAAASGGQWTVDLTNQPPEDWHAGLLLPAGTRVPYPNPYDPTSFVAVPTPAALEPGELQPVGASVVWTPKASGV